VRLHGRVEFTTPEGRTVTTRVPVNLVRQPLKLGDRVEIMHHPRFPGRTAINRTQGASTGLGIGLFFLLGAIAIFRGVSE
jgi:hypothetical protein